MYGEPNGILEEQWDFNVVRAMHFGDVGSQLVSPTGDLRSRFADLGQ